MKLAILLSMTYCLNIFACSMTVGGLNVTVINKAMKELDTMDEIVLSAKPKNIGAQLIVLKETQDGPECTQRDYKFSISPACVFEVIDFKSQTIDSSNCILAK